MNRIGVDELGQILRLVTDPDDRNSASLVCKKWWVMEGLSRSSLKLVNLDHLPRLLARYPNLTTFETQSVVSNADLALVAQSCPKLEAFILSHMSFEELELLTQFGRPSSAELRKKIMLLMEDNRVYLQGDEGLCAVANGCPKLSKIVIKSNHPGLLGIMTMITSAAHNLTHLELETCDRVTDQALEAIGSSSCRIRFLSLSCCSKITDAGLSFLAKGSCSKTIEQLKLSSCCEITDVGVLLLCKMLVLEELDLSCCDRVTDVGGKAVSTIRTLKKLNLACLINLTEKTFVALAKNCINLEVLILQQCNVTAASVDAFSGHKCLRLLNLLCCSCDDLRGSAFESLALGCPSLELIVVSESWRKKLLDEMQESTVSRFLDFRRNLWD